MPPKCKCGATPRLQTYMTFSFYYCEACKAEVGGKAEEPAKVDNGEEWTIPASASWSSNFRAPSLYGVPVAPSALTLPAGIAGLKGEAVTCASCHTKVGILNADLPDLLSAYRWSTYRHIDYIMPCGCGDPQEVMGARIHVSGRGFV